MGETVSDIVVTGASFVLSALSTLIALKRPRGPLLLTIARWLLVVIVALYAVVFLFFYRPEGWLPVVREFFPSTTLFVLLGAVAGTLLVQLRRR